MFRRTADRSIEAAERCFNEALETARAQDALSLELRAALTFAHFWIKQDRQEDAKQLLAQVYDRFTEGFGSPDLLSAKAMLQSLQTSPVNLAS
jgi:predicted ATPase